MKKVYSIKKTLVYGFIIFLIPLLAYLFLSSLDSFLAAYSLAIFIILLVSMTMECSILYLGNVKENTDQEGVVIGFIWFSLSFVLSLIIYTLVLDKGGFAEYFISVGVYYFIVPIITSGAGIAIREWRKGIED